MRTRDGCGWRSDGGDAVRGWRRDFGDADEQAACLDSLYPQCYDQLDAGRFRGEMIHVDLDGVIVVRERVNRRLMQTGSMRSPSIGWLLRSEGRFRFNREEFEPRSAIFYRQGSEFEIQAAPSDLIGIAIVPERLTQATRWLAPLSAPGACEGVRRLPDVVQTRLQRAAQQALALLDAAPDVARAARSGTLRQELVDLMLTVAALPRLDASRRRGRARTFDRVVLAAQREIATDLAHPVSTEALCRRIGVSRRNLFYAFDEVLGVSPSHYRQTLRLNAVRRAIKAQAPVAAPIADIAWTAGFAHPSRFAAEYRRLFGERPCETRRRALETARSRPTAD